MEKLVRLNVPANKLRKEAHGSIVKFEKRVSRMSEAI
jgi:hypothetical protein